MNAEPAPAPPRIFGITAMQADVVAVVRRGPSDWCHVGEWDTARRSYRSGSWIRGKLYPQRCDLSPDGRWLSYMAFKGNNRGELGESYIAFSRLPWLHALAAFRLDSTYARGIHFVADRKAPSVGKPTIGDLRPCLARYGLAITPAEQFAVERRRGFVEAASSPPRHAKDMWDERREAIVEKPQPGARTPVHLQVSGAYAAFRDSPNHRGSAAVTYRLVSGGGERVLEGVQWADFSREGDLLSATMAGALRQQRVVGLELGELRFECDLAALTPTPENPPSEARQW